MGKRILVTGGSGIIGSALVAELLAQGYEVRALARDPRRASVGLPRGVDVHQWAGDGAPLSISLLEDLESVIHLAGEPIAGGRWNEARKKRMIDSRVRSTESLLRGLGALATGRRPKSFICASAIGYYGDRAGELLDESSPPGSGFLAELCRSWEAATEPLDGLGIRRVNLRTGVVLHPSGGALAELLRVFRLGLGGPLGTGEQWMSWIHRDDEVSAILFLLAADSIRGPVNAVAPQAVTNRQFSALLGRALGRPAVLRAPGFALRIALGEMAGILLDSQKVRPLKLEQGGFSFRYPELSSALAELLKSPSSSSVSA